MDAEEAIKKIAHSVRVRKEWRDEAKEDFEFVAGHQWADEDITLLKDAVRPYVTFNEIGPIVDAITGHETANRQQITYIPRQPGMAGVNEVLSAAADWIRDECDAEAEESSAFYDAAVCGEGWTDTEIDYDEELDGKITVDKVDPLDMDIDQLAVKKNYADAKWVSRTKVYSRKEAQERWPDGEFEVSDNRRDPNKPVDVIAAAFYVSDSGDGGRPKNDPDNVLIHDFQWWEHETVYRVPAQLIPPPLAHILLKGYTMEQAKKPPEGSKPYVMPEDLKPDGNGLMTFSADIWDKLTENSGLPKEVFDAGLKNGVVLKQKRRTYWRMYISGEEELERKKTPTQDSFTYKAITGKRDRKNRCWYGVVRAMKDPQKWANKFMSSMLEIVGSSGKGGILYKPTLFLDPRQAENDWADPTKNIPVNDTANLETDMAPRPVSNMPSQMYPLMNYAAGKIPATAGVNPEVMGLSQALDPSGVMEEGRRQSGLNMLSYLFDSLRSYRKNQGRLLLSMIKRYIPPGRLIKITGPDGIQYVPLAYENDTAEYDVIVDESPTAPNIKQKTWDTYAALLPEIPALGSPQIVMTMMDFSPFPAALVQKLKAIGQSMSNQPPDPLKQAKTQEMQASAALKSAQAAQIGQDGQVKAMLAQIEASGEYQKSSAEIQKAQYDFMATVAKYHAALQENDTKQAQAYFDHLQSLYRLIESAHKTTQPQHKTAQTMETPNAPQ